MKKVLFITKKMKLDFKNSISINELEIDDIINAYGDDYTIDLNNHIMVIINDELIVTFKLIIKEN